MSKYLQNPILHLRKLSLFAILLALSASLSFAQTSGWDGEPDEDDDTENVEDASLIDGGEDWDVPAGKFDEVSIRLNGEDFTLTDELEVARKETLDVKIRHLYPGSPVTIKMQKGGINLDRKVFYCNAKGHLDLEIRTGNKKVSGGAVITYTPSNGTKKERKVHIVVD